MPVKVTSCPESGPVSSTYMLASMFLLPAAPGPPVPPWYQNPSEVLMGAAPSVKLAPDHVAVRSAVPHGLPNTNPPPLDGSSNTFMNPSHGSDGSGVTIVAASAVLPDRRPRLSTQTSRYPLMDMLISRLKKPSRMRRSAG